MKVDNSLTETYLRGIEAALLRINETLAETVDALHEQAEALRTMLARDVEPLDRPDKRCITLLDGSCIGTGCMHDSQSPKGGDST